MQLNYKRTERKVSNYEVINSILVLSDVSHDTLAENSGCRDNAANQCLKFLYRLGVWNLYKINLEGIILVVVYLLASFCLLFPLLEATEVWRACSRDPQLNTCT